MRPIGDLLTPIVSRVLDKRRRPDARMELFGDQGKREIPAPTGGTGSQRERSDEEASETPVADSCACDDRSQDRHRSPPIGRGPVQTNGLAQAPETSFDFDAHPDPNTTPQPEWVVPTDDLK